MNLEQELNLNLQQPQFKDLKVSIKIVEHKSMY